jgi:hypothetical protein
MIELEAGHALALDLLTVFMVALIPWGIYLIRLLLLEQLSVLSLDGLGAGWRCTEGLL